MRTTPMCLLLTGCVSSSAPDATQSTDAGRYDVDISFAPSPPTVGDLEVSLDVSEGDGAPAEACAITVTATMPEHGHGGLEDPVVVEVGGGSYAVRWDCWMAGHWELTADLACPGGDDRLVIDVDVD